MLLIMRRPSSLRKLASVTILVAMSAAACGDSSRTIAFDPVEATIQNVQLAIRGGRTTCRAVVQAHLERIEAYGARMP